MDKQKILLAEDDEFLRDLYRDILTDAGFLVETVSDGRAALKILSEKTFDLTLLDVNMPEMTGIDVANKLNENKTKQKIVFLTNLEDETVTAATKKFQCTCLLKSALSPSEFIVAVKQNLKNNQV